jgi:hypothetical protein
MRDQFAGLRVSIHGPVPGGADGFGPILWRAKSSSGAGLTIEGGGKGKVNCLTGKFEKLLLSPVSAATHD